MILLDRAIKYAEDVTEGREVTTVEVIVQCTIFLEDYNKHQYEKDFKFIFSEKKLSKINNLLKLFNFATGYVKKLNVLEGLVGFQALFLCAIFGWRYKNDLDKFRYRDVVLFIPRKNTKTFIIAIVILLLMLTEDDFSEFYSICIDRDLATEVRKAMSQILGASPLINKHFFVSDTLTGIIKCKITNSFFLPRTSKANKNNAIRPAAVCCDEIGAFTSNDNVQAMRKGQLSVKNPLMLKITTAYAETDSIMLEELNYDRSVLNGTVTNPRLFCLLYYCTKEEAWTDEGLFKSNPLRVEENYKEIREDRATAKIKLSEQKEYLTKNMNIFLETNELNKYIDIESWKKCRISDKEFRERIKGKKIKVGIDLSVTTDLTAVGIVFEMEGLIYCNSHGFLPKDNLEDRRENIDYKEYEKKGYCDIHEGRTVDYDLVEKYVRGLEVEYDCTIDSIITDPMNANELMGRLAEDYDVTLLKQTYTNLSPSTKEYRKKVYDFKVRYAENELLDWNMSNATTTVGKSDDEMLNKQDKNKQRIDMAVVLVFAHTELIEIKPVTPLLTEEYINRFFKKT